MKFKIALGISISLATGLALTTSCLRGSNPVTPVNNSYLTTASNTSTPKSEIISNQLIVKTKEGYNLKNILTKMQGIKIKDSFSTDAPFYLLETESRVASEKAIEYLQKNSSVQVADFNRNYYLDIPKGNTAPISPVKLLSAPNDPLFSQQWSMTKVGALQAWSATQGDTNMIVAVIDTGIDYNHPDLAGKVIKGPDYTGESNGDPIDGFGHGTHVAGIIGAIANNGIGVAGIAPNVKLMAVKVLSKSGGGNLFAIAGGMIEAQKKGSKIINMSLGGPPEPNEIMGIVGWWLAEKKGVLLVAAAGNSGGPVGMPALIHKYFMAIGASDENDNLASFSCFGRQLSVVSPGTKIMNTTPTYHCPLNDYGYAMNYAALNGTSMACPLAAGLSALVWSKHPDWTAKQVRAHIEKTAVDLGVPGKDDKFGFGRINAEVALK